MNWGHILATFLALSVIGPCYSGVWAASMAECRTGWEWNKNSLGQDPCTLISILDAACHGAGSWGAAPLNSSQSYNPPHKNSTGELTCDCNTVLYSIYMACTVCQGDRNFSWTTWIFQCETVYVTRYPHPIPYGTAIPHWAFYDITTLHNETYDDTVAMSIGRNPEATHKPLNTGDLHTTTSSHSGSFPASGLGLDRTTGGDAPSEGKDPTVVIASGVVGGVIVLIIAAIAVWICLKRRKQDEVNRRPGRFAMDRLRQQPSGG